ncbi:hypothetical protein [Castellaniella sp. S9]|uniref:hypothetical protein n=1 Tax=Castellaniella sp. S9 TaxID=2993652 RepID=UPI0022B35177|nr:hypothetical protein [Castellaniella sp. S9]
MNNKIVASQTNTILDDLAVDIGLRATILLAAWWGGNNIVVPAMRPERSVLASIIGEEPARRLSALYGGEQIFIPRLTWFAEIRKARQVHNLLKIGLARDEVARVMIMTVREVDDMSKIGQFAAQVVEHEHTARRTPPDYELDEPKLRGGRGGKKPRRAVRAPSPENADTKG